MVRLARIVVPDLPHHVTARGNRREPIFFEDGDEEVYLDLLREQLAKARVELWASAVICSMAGSPRWRWRRTT
jgi:putative transposase